LKESGCNRRQTDKPVADLTRYTYGEGYGATLCRSSARTILQAILTDRAPFLKRIIARLVFGLLAGAFAGG
jgi:hypothetical protein